MVTYPVLTMPDFEKPLIIHVDSNDLAIDARERGEIGTSDSQKFNNLQRN